jgi:uncharacterized repeat protein (TIGR03803 family)
MGSVFSVTPAGVLTILASFGGTNGSQPTSALVEGDDGILYGTTMNGGLKKASSDWVDGFPDCGTVFTITPNGSVKPLLFFGGTNGANPRIGLIRGNDGAFYGTTAYGGPNKVPPALIDFARGGFGTVFRLSTNGTLSPVVAFNGSNGQGCYALQQKVDGTLYGICLEGGATNTANPYQVDSWQPFIGSGTIFRVSPTGKFETLVWFHGTNGSSPVSLVLAKDGNLYGTTAAGGIRDRGTIFRLEPNGKFTTLYSFTEGNGSLPSYYSSLMQGADGNLYGTTSRRGKYACGSIFRLTLPPATSRNSH